MLIRSNRSSFRRTAWIAVCALLLQILVPLVHQAAATPLDSLRICSAFAKNSSGPATDKSSGQKSQSCPVCQSLHMLGNGFVPPEPVALSFVLPAQHDFVAFDATLVLAKPAYSIAQPRAPPTLA